ncbi:hypothetical protein Tco_0776851, partial [Tanacetum coccineum]
GHKNGTNEGNNGMCSTSIGTTTPNIGSVLINVTDKPTTDLNNIGLILAGSTSYAKLVTGETSRKSVNFCTLITPAENRTNVVVPLESSQAVKLYGVPMTMFSEDGLSAIATKVGTPLMLDSYTSDMCMQSWGRLSYARAMIELRADMELKDTIVVVMPKLIGEGFYMCSIRVEYEWKPPRNNASSSGKNKQATVASKEVINSNPIDVLNSVEKDDDLGTNGRHSKSAGKGPNSEVFLKLTLMDDDEKSLPKVISTENVDSDSEWKMWTTKRDDDYDPYDDDLYESHDMFENLKAIYDDLDITILGRKKK